MINFILYVYDKLIWGFEVNAQSKMKYKGKIVGMMYIAN
jgi:hypothetical protein